MEAVALGSLNEDAVKSALLGVPCVAHVVPIGLIVRLDGRHSAASQEDVAAVDLSLVAESSSSILDKNRHHGRELTGVG